MTDLPIESFESRHGRTLARLPDLREQRDPSAATQQLRFTPAGNPQIDEWDAEQAVRWGYYANVIAYRCVQIRAQAIASLPFRAGKDPERPEDYDPTAPLARLLGPAPGGPAPGLPARKLWSWTVAQRLVTGKNAWEIETDGGRGKGKVLNLWPLVSSSLKAIPSHSGASWFRAFTYGRSDDPKQLAADQVFYGWSPSLTDFRQPESALQSARYDLSIAVMADRYSYAFLKNGAMPAAVVVTRAFANKGDRSKFRRQFTGNHAGPDNANKVLFAEAEDDALSAGGGDISKTIDVKVLGLSQKDAQFIEQHKHSLAMVAISLGVPWSKLDASGRTFDNATQEDKAWWSEVILPDVQTYQDEVNMGLAERVGREYGWFDLSGVDSLKIKPEPTTAKVGAPALYQSRIITLNEARADYGLPPIAGGDVLISPEELAELNPASGAEPTRIMVGGSERASETPPAPVPAADPPPEVRTPAPDGPDPAQVEARRAGIWKRTNATAVTLERQWERSFRRLFARQQDATLGRLTGKRGRQAERRDTIDPAQIFDRNFWAEQTSDLADDLYESVASAAAARVSESFGIEFDLTDPRVEEFIRARANQLAGQVTDTTYSQIQSALADGAAAGDDTVELAARVRDVFEDATRNRSVVIARTEVVSAFNGSTAELAAIMPDDVVAGQEWIATRDGRTRSSHAGADGQVRGVGQSFDVGGTMLAYPGDPSGPADETIQCRCTLALLTPEDMAERAERSALRVRLDLADALVTMAAHHRHFDRAETRDRLRSAA